MKNMLSLSLIASLIFVSASVSASENVGYCARAKNAVVSAVVGAKNVVVSIPSAAVNTVATYAPGFKYVNSAVVRVTGSGEGFFARNSKNISAVTYAAIVAAVAYGAYVAYNAATEEEETF